MGNEEWVGVWPDDLPAARLGLSRTTSTSPCSQLQLNRSASFSHVQKENRLFYSCVARRLRTGGGGEEAASQMAAVFLERSTVYSPPGLVISFTWYFFMRERIWAYGLLDYIIFNLVVDMTDTVCEQIPAFKLCHTLPFLPCRGIRACLIPVCLLDNHSASSQKH